MLTLVEGRDGWARCGWSEGSTGLVAFHADPFKWSRVDPDTRAETEIPGDFSTPGPLAGVRASSDGRNLTFTCDCTS